MREAHDLAAVDDKGLACHVGRHVREEEQEGPGEFVGAAKPSQRNTLTDRHGVEADKSLLLRYLHVLARHGTAVTSGAMRLKRKPCEAVIELGPHPVLERRRLTDSGGKSPHIPGQSSEPNTTDTRCIYSVTLPSTV